MRRVLLLALVACVAVGWAQAQDLAPRKGFRVRVTAPQPAEAVMGKVIVRAEVTAPREADVTGVDFYVDDKLVFTAIAPPYQVMHDFGPRAVAHVVRAVAHHRDGPTVSDFVITKELALSYTVNVQRVVLDVSVRLGKRVLQGLGRDDFHVSEDGKPQRVTDVSADSRPILVAVVLDSSGSMKDRMKETQDAACRFIDALRAGDRGLVIDFDERVFLLQEVTGDKAQLCAAVRSTEALGGTAMHDAVHAAYRQLHEADAERRAVVLLTDGDDNQSQLEFKALLEEARFADVTVYAIGLGVPILGTSHSSLEHLADETGGRAFFVSKADELAGVYDLIADELRTMYQVTYTSSNETFDGRFIKIRVDVAGRSDVDIRHRSGYKASAP